MLLEVKIKRNVKKIKKESTFNVKNIYAICGLSIYLWEYRKKKPLRIPKNYVILRVIKQDSDWKQAKPTYENRNFEQEDYFVQDHFLICRFFYVIRNFLEKLTFIEK